MKATFAILIVAALALTFGMAYADEFPIMAGNDVGTELYLSAFPTNDTVIVARDFSSDTPGSDVAHVDIGTALRDSAAKDEMYAGEVTGSAAGGMKIDDEKTVIWDNLLGRPGGSDLP